MVSQAKYDHTEAADYAIVERVKELSEHYHCTMTQIALAWQFAKGVTSTLIGATKAGYFDDAAGCFNVRLNQDDLKYLEEPYLPHKIMGAIPPPQE